MIEAIAVSAPKKFRTRAKLMLDSNFSWVFASSAAYAWYVYLMLRFVWNIPRCEILDWRKRAGRSYGRYETIYKVFSYLVNVSVFSPLSGCLCTFITLWYLGLGTEGM
ncbi:hypothetical protein [Vibrio hepatarius]|uniref:hypothetical protein n=1 Tax=Vibrio hepatarius TaxID=171383 RepID=UPI001C0A1C63|nr:hypothetical protein [Vibrio hepatarius]MBU2899071.1 hypothetical protein [Vibrio hepatarius]